MHQSIATIDAPEFINLQPLDINPLMSSCEIKVLYIGQNRNRSFITKEVASEMAKTLRGAPIVGYYKTDKEDFADHGDKIIIDDEGIKFECMTKPYGFVAPDAKVWFQKFEDKDEFGNTYVREYLMTTGYLWTGQFEECKSAVDGEGKPQSMELDEDSLEGNWSYNEKENMEFFIINDAIFSKLCILGDDVEPCFEGASVTAPKVSNAFTKVDDSFRQTLFSMMEDLKKYTLKGGQTMEQETKFSENLDTTIETDQIENENTIEVSEENSNFEKKEEEDKKDKPNKCEKDKKEDKDMKEEEDKEVEEEEDKEDKKKDKNFSLLEQKYNDLSSDTDKADVIANKRKYSLDEIEAKLSVICFRKKVDFGESTKETTPTVTFNLTEDDNEIPAYISALRNTQKERQ